MNNKITIAIVLGTRPEFIKLKELIKLVKKSTLSNNTIVINTGQHQDLLDDQVEPSTIKIDENLQIERPSKELSYLTGKCLIAFTNLRKKYPNLQYLIGQGDTNTVLCLSLFCYLENLKFIHIEAGLRTNNLHSPFPEEFNRRIGSIVSYFNFSPTIDAQENLIKEGVAPSKIMICGNTGIDALYSHINYQHVKHSSCGANSLIVTIHRRERNNTKVVQLASKLNALINDEILSNVIWVLHPNYSVELNRQLLSFSQIQYVQPLMHCQFIKLYAKTNLVITDSGGVTEEAITIGIRTIIFREESERFIPKEVQHRVLISTDIRKIEQHIKQDQDAERQSSNYYGSGEASKKIFDWLKKETEVNQKHFCKNA